MSREDGRFERDGASGVWEQTSQLEDDVDMGRQNTMGEDGRERGREGEREIERRMEDDR